MVKDAPHPDSFFNSNSETALTLFMLGNLDSWSQVSSLPERPREETKRSSWSESFFRSFSGSKDVEDKCNERKEEGLWDRPKIRRNLSLKKREVQKTKKILLFEFEVACGAVHCGKEKSRRNVSFLDISDKYSKVRYDAVLIIPEKKIFVFFESKLETDTSAEGEGKNRLDQVVKGLESAFLLTNHEKSRYSDWDFRYVLICPRLLDQYALTGYHHVLENVEKYIARYNDLLNRKKSSSVNEETYPEYFGKFVKEAPQKLSKVYWNDMGKVLNNDRKNFFSDYFERLERSELSERKVKSVRKRLKRAGISF